MEKWTGPEEVASAGKSRDACQLAVVALASGCPLTSFFQSEITRSLRGVGTRLPVAPPACLTERHSEAQGIEPQIGGLVLRKDRNHVQMFKDAIGV